MAHLFNLCCFNLRGAMIACGVNNASVFLGNTPALRLATDIFGNDFTTCMYKKFAELDINFKTYYDMTQAQGKICLLTGIKRNIKLIIQWVRDDQCLGRNPEMMAFPVVRSPAHLRRYKTHTKFVSSVLTLIDAVKPGKFPSQTNWADWIPTFLNYLRAIPGRNRVPLKYICRENDIPNN